MENQPAADQQRWVGLAPDLEVHGERDLVLTGESIWITVGSASIHIGRTDDGVYADIWPLDHESVANDPVASAQALHTDLQIIEEDPDGRLTPPSL